VRTGRRGGKRGGSAGEALTWDDVYAILCINTGWPPSVVDGLRWPAVRALLKQWRLAPPPHVSLAALTNYKPPPDPQQAAVPTLRRSDILAMFGGTSSGKEFQVTTRWADDPVIKAAFAPPD